MIIIIIADESYNGEGDGDPGGAVKHKENGDKLLTAKGCWVKVLRVLGESGGNGIKATRVPGVAFCDAPYGEPGTAQGTVKGEGLQRISRAAWMKTTSASAVTATGEGVQ